LRGALLRHENTGAPLLERAGCVEYAESGSKVFDADQTSEVWETSEVFDLLEAGIMLTASLSGALLLEKSGSESNPLKWSAASVLLQVPRFTDQPTGHTLEDYFMSRTRTTPRPSLDEAPAAPAKSREISDYQPGPKR